MDSFTPSYKELEEELLSPEFKDAHVFRCGTCKKEHDIIITCDGAQYCIDCLVDTYMVSKTYLERIIKDNPDSRIFFFWENKKDKIPRAIVDKWEN